MKVRLLIWLLLFSITAGAQNFTNKGKEFWVGYGHNQLFTTNAQSMVLYLSAEQAANVTVSVNGTSWVRTYSIPANTAIPTDLLPKTGPDDCRIIAEGLSTKGIHIESDVPIVAYVHTYGQYTSGATMLIPVESFSYTYFSVNPEQNSGDSYSWFYVVASENNTTIRITPSRPTAGGQLQNVPFVVNLNKGEIYNVMGGINGSSSYDLSGSKIQSLQGADGVCHPVGVFSGSSRTYICAGDPLNSGADFVMQQVFPLNAWGNKYITALTSKSTGAGQFNSNKYRVYVREPGTLVRKNGAIMTGLVNNFYYDFLATTNDVITSTKPILMAQFIPSANGCGTTGLGDPEMFILSPVEQAIKKVVFYNSDKEAISVNYLTIVIPTNGVASLLIDGSNTFDNVAAHPNAPGYSIVVKQMPVAPMQHTASSDSGFTAITYGLGQFESYGYNAGTNLRNLESSVMVKNLYGTGLTPHTCPGTAFHLVFKTTYKPSSINWQLSAVTGLMPNADVLLSGYPIPTDSVIENQRKFYLYELPGTYTFATGGTYTIPVSMTDQLIENCSFSTSLNIPLTVIPGPVVSFSTLPEGCVNKSHQFTGSANGTILTNRWWWDFGDATIDSVQTVNKIYTVDGDYMVKLMAVRNDGCTGEQQKMVKILPEVKTTLVESICDGQAFEGYTTSGVYTDIFSAANGCDSIRTLDLTVKPKASFTLNHAICDGETFEGYTTSGTFIDHFTAANGCDSTRTLNLTVKPKVTFTLNQSICDGQTFEGYSTSGTYVDHFMAANGCDSARTLNLTVKPTASVTLNQSICAGQNFEGYSTSGTYVDHFIAVNGCDSTRTLNLTVKPTSSFVLNQSICNGQAFEGYSTSGTYVDHFTAANGCDSTRTLNLTVNAASFFTLNKTICAGDIFEGYSTGGTYIDHFTGANGCDSTRTLNLTIKPKATFTLNQSICAGQTFEGYSTTGTYIDHFLAANGCDSTRTLHLTVKLTATFTFHQSVCQGTIFEGYTTSGTYVDHFVAVNGCDSIRTLILTVKPTSSFILNKSICEGQIFEGYTTSGTYIDHFTAANGCDSTRTLNLAVNKKVTFTLNQSICAGQSFEGYTIAGTYIDHFTAVNGCDSARTLVLTIKPTSSLTLNKTICDGTTFEGYSTSGTYIDHFIASNGCDSIRTLNLTVKPKASFVFAQSICSGQTFEGYNATGIYVDHFTAANGCDSTRTLNLTVKPAATFVLNKAICQGRAFEGYTVTGTYVDHFTAANGCDSTRTLNLTVKATSSFTLNKAICSGETFEGYNAAGTYVDHFTAANGCDSMRTLVLSLKTRSTSTVTKAICQGDTFEGHSTAGTFTDHFTAANGCDSARTLTLIIKAKATATITKTICTGDIFEGYNSSGTYVDHFIAANGCDSTRTLKLTVLSKPIVSLGADKTLCNGETIRLAAGNYPSYLWQDNSRLDHFIVRQPGIYSVKVTNECGDARDEIVIRSGACDPFFPNAFTPDGNGTNDVFKILNTALLNNYSLRIYNRYGKEIFVTRDYGKGWDGTIKGVPTDAGAYLWTCSFTKSGTVTNLHGTVLLIR